MWHSEEPFRNFPPEGGTVSPDALLALLGESLSTVH
jgi:hypothetical protein